MQKSTPRRVLLNDVKAALSGLIQYLATESPLKMMTNAFYFTLKTLFVLKTFRFCLDFLVMYKNGLVRKIRLISTFMTLWLTLNIPCISESCIEIKVKLHFYFHTSL